MVSMMLDIENVETAVPGVVTAVHGDTVDCRPVIRKVLPNGAFDINNPVLKGVPLMKIGGANAEISFPSKVGDRVTLLAFSRDSSKWRKSSDEDIVPDSCSGLSVDDFVAIPVVKASSNGAAKIRVTEEGDIEFTPASGRKTVCKSDLLCTGKVLSASEVCANVTIAGDEVIEAGSVKLSTHAHPTSVGPSGTPTPSPA